MTRILGPDEGGRFESSGLNRFKNRFILSNYLREMRKLQIGGLSGGNSISLISNGEECFAEFCHAIKRAKKSVNIETYIFNSDVSGWKIARLMAEASSRGVEVNLMYDSVGCIKTSRELFAFLRKGGVEVVEYNPVIPWRKFWNITFRDHRKILVVDGTVGYIGGINIGDEYFGGRGKMPWRDTHLKVEGPAVKDIQFFFVENWFRNGGRIVERNTHFPVLRKRGNTLLMIVSTKSRRNIRPIYESYVSAIKNSKKFIYITNAYFIPDRKIYHYLCEAAEKGVDVRVLVPEKYDMPFVKNAVRFLYKRFLRHGVRIYEYNKTILHSKTAVIDGIWSTVGSSNLDRLSFKRNLEVNAVILDEIFGSKMTRMFMKDLECSTEVTLAEYRRRTLIEYVADWICYRFRNIL